MELIKVRANGATHALPNPKPETTMPEIKLVLEAVNHFRAAGFADAYTKPIPDLKRTPKVNVKIQGVVDMLDKITPPPANIPPIVITTRGPNFPNTFAPTIVIMEKTATATEYGRDF
jgi:hypothetical protein